MNVIGTSTEKRIFEGDPLPNIQPVFQKLLSKGIAYDLITEDELIDNIFMQKYKYIIVPNANLFDQLFPGKWLEYLSKYAGITAGSDPNDNLVIENLDASLDKWVLSTPDRCSAVLKCTNVNLTYLQDKSCKTTCLNLRPLQAINPSGNVDIAECSQVRG